MRMLIVVLSLIVLPVFGGLAAVDQESIGTWELVSDSPQGQQYAWTLVVTEEQGRLTGKLSGGPPPHEFALLEPKGEGEKFTFKIQIQGEVYTVEATVSRSKFEGKWRNGGSRGTMNGTRRPPSKS